MKTRPTFKKTCDDFRRRESMSAQTPAGSSAPLRAAEPFYPLPTSDAEGTQVCIAATASTWDNAIVSTEGVARDGGRHDRDRTPFNTNNPRPRSLSVAEREIPEQLADILMNMFKGPDGEELGDAFRYAAEVPPITKQSLSELDIQNIINNMKLRHDVNFDRDLSFRPNSEGPKGQQKKRQSEKYWLALEAELHLYMRLFQGTPPLRTSGSATQSVLVQHAQRRIPKIFETIHEVLMSLVPDRDYQRVDELLDVQMLMQQIERGVCDMVKLVEWTSHLLKEHCAPMRDIWVDEMVELMRAGAANNDVHTIVESINRLLAMLETMKLDVANHQIRNLKSLLIEDTINFEKHYHLERIVNYRAKVNIDAAQKWWGSSVQQFQHQCTPNPTDMSRLRSETFARAVVSNLFCRVGQKELPDTFYLDYDRLRVLRSEIEDLVHLEICSSMFDQLLKEFEYDCPVSNATKDELRSSLSAIVGEGIGHGRQTWMCNSEPLSLEIYRQAQLIAGRPLVFHYNILHYANQRLRSLFNRTFTSRASALEASILPEILSLASKLHTSSPTELYNSLVALPPLPSTHSFIPIPPTPDTFSFSSNIPQDRLHDLSKRISHIIILHWRIWAPIAYAQDGLVPQPLQPTQPVAIASAQLHNTPPLPPPAPICPTAT